MTLDGGETANARTGHPLSITGDGKQLVLQAANVSTSISAWCLAVIDGPGAGQWARVVAVGASTVHSATISLDRAVHGLQRSSLLQACGRRDRE